MRIAIVLYGAIRISSIKIKDIIKKHNEIFLDALFRNKTIDINFFLCAFEPVENPQYLWYNTTNEYYYDINNLKKELSELNLNITYIFTKQPDLNAIIKTKNGAHAPSLFLLHYYRNFYNYIKDNNLVFDYIVRSRNDMYINISKINSYLNDNIMVLSSRCHTNPQCSINDYFYIIPFKNISNFYNISVKQLEHIIKNSWDQEMCENKLMLLLKGGSLIKNIKDDDVQYLKLDHHNWFVKNGKKVLK
tara:strand:+ start:5017 stop:5757 length:741 start_codon:yes stop_codon:yes gene_type:complete